MSQGRSFRVVQYKTPIPKHFQWRENMDQTIIEELNQKFKIYYPYEEISIYLRQSDLSDSPIPTFTEIFQIPINFYPTKISFRSFHASEGFPPDKTTSLVEFKRKNPTVSYQKLELLYEKNLLPKYEWNESFETEKLSWDSLLSICNDLVERSATEYYVFLRFSMIDPETIELITN